MPFIFAASGSMALSKASGPSSTPPVIWPRSAILHRAAASMVDGILDVTVSTAETMATRGVPSPACVNRSIAFWMVALRIEIGEDVDRRVGDQQGLRIRRHIHNEHVANPPRSPQACRGGGHRAHELVGVKAALHEQLAFQLM